jgi:hypothetical protein
MSNIVINTEYLEDNLVKRQIKHIKKYYELRQNVFDKYLHICNKIRLDTEELYYNHDLNLLNDTFYKYKKYEKEDEFKKIDENEDFYELRMVFKCKKYIEYLDEEYKKYLKDNNLEIMLRDDLDDEKIIGYDIKTDEIIVKY